MKQSTLLIAAATTLLLAVPASAQSVRQAPFDRTAIMRDLRPVASAAAPEWQLVDTIVNAFSFYSHGADPFSYDPRLNVLAFVKRGAPRQDGAANRIWLYHSTNLGATWEAPFGPITDPTATGAGNARYPSVIVNPTHSLNPEEYFYYYSAPMLPGGAFTAQASGLLSQDGEEIIPQQITEAVDGATWSSDGRVIETVDGTHVITAGSLSDNSIGVRVLDLSSGVVTQTVPAAFDSVNFDAPPDANSKTSTVAGISTDANGGIYILALGTNPTWTAQIGDTMPVPFVIKSTDKGATWSAASYLPLTMLKDYVTGEGFNVVDSSSTSWNAWGFAATAPDRYSIIFPYYQYEDAGPRMQMLEARFNNGNWNIFKLADINSYYPLDNGGGVFDNQQLLNEVQLVKTADGNTLLAKWTQLLSYISEGDVDGEDATDKPDTFLTTDVFVASRAVNQGTWSEPKNVTESPELDRTTWIPTQTIPNNLATLPLLEVGTVIDDTLDLTQLQRWVDGQLVIADRPQLVFTTIVDATPLQTSAPIVGEATASRISSIAPNPSAGMAVVGVNIAKAGVGSIEVWNALGERVATLATGTLRAGSNSYSLAGNDLPVGAYYVALTIDGQTMTQPFSVVR